MWTLLKQNIRTKFLNFWKDRWCNLDEKQKPFHSFSSKWAINIKYRQTKMKVRMVKISKPTQQSIDAMKAYFNHASYHASLHTIVDIVCKTFIKWSNDDISVVSFHCASLKVVFIRACPFCDPRPRLATGSIACACGMSCENRKRKCVWCITFPTDTFRITFLGEST